MALVRVLNIRNVSRCQLRLGKIAKKQLKFYLIQVVIVPLLGEIWLMKSILQIALVV